MNISYIYIILYVDKHVYIYTYIILYIYIYIIFIYLYRCRHASFFPPTVPLHPGRLQLLHIHHRHLQIRPLRTQRARQAPDGRGRWQLRKVTGEDRDAGGGQEPGWGKRLGGGLGYGGLMWVDMIYPLVNKQLDPENSPFLMETNLPTPMTARVYVNLPEGNYIVIDVIVLCTVGSR